MPRPPPHPTPDWIRNISLHYLDRYAPTVSSFRAWLRRRVDAAVELHGTDREEARRWEEAQLARFLELGLLDDERWAVSKARALRRRGGSSRSITAALRAKGIPEELARDALEDEEAPSELEAARKLARKRRLGPWRTGPGGPEVLRKELAVLGRKGFSYDTARKALEGDADDQ